MDFQDLVSEIVARVAQRMGEPMESRPALLVLTPEHGERCHAMLESTRLHEYYRIDCALEQNYQVCVENYEGVLLFGISNEALTRLAGGVCDTPFTALAQQAILLGKRIFVAEEEVELFRYQQTAPPAYYSMLTSKLALLKASGVMLCAYSAMEDTILSGADAPCGPQARACHTGTMEVRIEKRIITERDLEKLCSREVGTLRIGQKAILTDLACDFIHSRGIAILRG